MRFWREFKHGDEVEIIEKKIEWYWVIWEGEKDENINGAIWSRHQLHRSEVF